MRRQTRGYGISFLLVMVAAIFGLVLGWRSSSGNVHAWLEQATELAAPLTGLIGDLIGQPRSIQSPRLEAAGALFDPTLEQTPPGDGYTYISRFVGTTEGTDNCLPDTLVGRVFDVEGMPLSDVAVWLYDPQPVGELSISGANGEAGIYAFALEREMNTYYVVILDNTGAPLSPVFTLEHAQEECHILDWHRVSP